jgi:hypothetical protein
LKKNIFETIFMTAAEAYQSSSLLFREKEREGEGKVEGERERK